MSDQEQLGGNQIKDMEKTLSLVPVYACCCFMTTLVPCRKDDSCNKECIGVQADQECLCIKGTCAGCRPVTDIERNDWCDVLKSRFIMKGPDTCCRVSQQCCCLVMRGALPCDTSVPCMMNILGLTVNFKGKCSCGCCKTIEEMTEWGPECKLDGQDQVIAARGQTAQSGTQ